MGKLRGRLTNLLILLENIGCISLYSHGKNPVVDPVLSHCQVPEVATHFCLNICTYALSAVPSCSLLLVGGISPFRQLQELFEFVNFTIVMC